MKILLITLLTLFFGLCASAQSFFKPLPKYSAPSHIRAMGIFNGTTTPSPDSTYTGFRPIVSAGVYGYTQQQGSSLFTGAGISWEHDTWDATSSKWYTQYSIAGLFYAGGTSAPTGITAVEAAGINLSFLNKLIGAGVAYNFQTKTLMPTFSLSVSLNN